GQPTTKPADEDAAHFLIRMVHKYPNEVTIYEGGPMTNLALAISLEPQFPQLAKELVFMGGGLSPEGDNPEFVTIPATSSISGLILKRQPLSCVHRGRRSCVLPPTFQ